MTEMTNTYLSIVNHLLEEGTLVAPRGIECYEVLNYHYTLQSPTQSHIQYTNLPERQPIYEKYCKEEHEWYMKGSLLATEAPSKFWLKLADEHGNINSNYGYMVIHEQKYPLEKMEEGYAWYSALEQVVATLSRDPSSRQAVAHYNLPTHYWEGNKDVPCTLSNQFLIRGGALHTVVNMRSQDVWKGTPFDISWFSWLAMHVADKLGVGYGPVHMNIGSMHLYKANEADARKLAGR